MSLVGNLEDLSLPDILQIVSLSKKSGILVLEQEGLQGKIYIRNGRVIQTVSPRSGRTLGEILSSKGLIKPDDLKKALELQSGEQKKELLGKILVTIGAIEEKALEKVVQEQIEEAIVYFLSWKEGTFSFELSSIESRGEISVDPHAFILEKGIDTQWLVLEGTRMMDEQQHDAEGTPVEDTVADAFIEEEPVAEKAAPESKGGIVLVDDDPVFRDQAKERLTHLNYRVLACDGTEEALKAVEELSKELQPVVITDIVFPTSDGRGFLGGLELIEKLKRSQPEIPIIAITAYPDDNVKAKISGFGVGTFLFKSLGEGEGDQDKFYDDLTGALADIGGSGLEPSKVEVSEIKEQDKLIDGMEDDVVLEEEPDREEGSEELAPASLERDEFSLLQEMLQELKNPRATSEIGLLILRFASELLNRAVLFVVKGGNAVGLGGFGVDVSAGGRKGGVRGITIPLNEPSLLEEVVRNCASFRGPVAHTAVNVRLMEELGGQTPTESVAFPLVAGGKVRVILYGDNLPDEAPLPSLQAMEIFLTQAGLTLERVLLEKKLQDTKTKRG